jgi:hypothetical protein
MEALVTGTAEDIKACANACDTYSKKKLIGPYAQPFFPFYPIHSHTWL